MFLLDTVMLSELRKKEQNIGVATWFDKNKNHSMYISAITIGEIRRGICLQEKKDPIFASRLSAWLETLLYSYGEHILPVSTRVALEWGKLSAQLGHSDADGLIAATAFVHNLTVITRNHKHFISTGVSVHNPWL